MKTAIRIIETQYSYSNPTYRNLTITVLGKKSYSNDLETIGHITWQSDTGTAEKAKLDSNVNLWYGISYKVETAEPEHIITMGKLAKYIKENTEWRVQPSEVIALIGGEEYVSADFTFVPKFWIGTVRRFHLLIDGGHYSNVYAANQIIAQKQLEKFAKGKAGIFTLEDKGVLQA